MNPMLNALRTCVKPLSIVVLSLAAPVLAHPQSIIPNNSYAEMVQRNSALQSNLTQQMINSGGRSTSSSGAAVCNPPFDLMRGPAGLVPPQLQGDPRYQEYLRCRYGNVPITQAMANAPALPVSRGWGAGPSANYTNPVEAGSIGGGASPQQPPAQHLPLAATDFVPVRAGHPMIEQQLAVLALPPDERSRVINNVNATFAGVAQNYRENNLTVSICIAYVEAANTLNGSRLDPMQMREFIARMNDAIASGPTFRMMSDADKQNMSDAWIFETSVLVTLKSSAVQGDAQAAQQATQVAQIVLQRLNAL